MDHGARPFHRARYPLSLSIVEEKPSGQFRDYACDPPPAQAYQESLVSALFQQWGHVTADMARFAPGERVPDVACRTGVLACAVAETRRAPTARRRGVLAMARARSARIERGAANLNRWAAV